MKKILFGSAAAICAVAGFSSFKSVHHFAGPYYFRLNTGVNVQKNTAGQVTNAQVTKLAAAPSSCTNGTGTGYDCVVTITQHINAAGTQLTQAATIASTLYTRAHV